MQRRQRRGAGRTLVRLAVRLRVRVAVGGRLLLAVGVPAMLRDAAAVWVAVTDTEPDSVAAGVSGLLGEGVPVALPDTEDVAL